MTFPEGYKDSFTKYHTINFPATKQVRYYYANSAAVAAAKAGKSLPDGSVLFAEVYAAKLDADSKPITGGDGFYVADKLLLYTAMAREEGWEILRFDRLGGRLKMLGGLAGATLLGAAGATARKRVGTRR